jgi:hypothetical protein
MKKFLITRCRLAVLAVVALGLIGFATPAKADWNPGDPYKMHYPQLPDLTDLGMDVLATLNPTNPPFWKLLADDFQCTATGPITDIHIWGSWLGDHVGQNTTFKLSIHLDDRSGPYSKPGPQVWSAIFTPGMYAAMPYGPPVVGEHFFDPNLNAVIGHDSQVWQYNFMNIAAPFVQQQGAIYWLDVQAVDPDPLALFGWKTTNPVQTPHFEDDAVFGDTLGFNGPLLPSGWRELVYPAGHPFQGQSIDLAFVIVPEPGTATLLGLGLLALLTFRRCH